MLPSNNFDVSFVVSLGIPVWYIHQDNSMSFLVMNLTSSGLTDKKNQNLKETYAFVFKERTKPYPKKNSSA